ncbi:hypothetical protein GCM10012275_33430 [Longimycelium tulufanense]|uniref:YbaB/EbfC DNA-binding family protein n=1 Tax=Longimycelium tulufanense TaxID=907463 RepID=A0A8J3FX71_9PSEU|nr:YbaB/EbfC family DNA-binding protein [Longimycelium tulufanense]GGM59622.1 hypothetical protein GCM10012275_33430 [Longimycelium tulufanense]
MTAVPGGDELGRRLAAVRGRARNVDGSVQVAATVHGAIAELRLDERALAMGAERLGAEIVRLAAQASVSAMREELAELAHELGADRAAELIDALDPEDDRRG